MQGGINAIDLNDSTVFEVNVTNPPMIEDFMLNAHGISVWTDPNTGNIQLFWTRLYLVGCQTQLFYFDIFSSSVFQRKKNRDIVSSSLTRRHKTLTS